MSATADGTAHSGMTDRLAAIWRGASPDLRRRLVLVYAFLIALNVGLWLLTLLASTRYASLLGLGLLAYTLGLRHAVDPDHIAAIDNTTRKLMQEGKRPVGVGFFFSLGHSTVVFALSVVIAVTTSILKQKFSKGNFAHLQSWGGIVGTSISGAFLLLIAAINIIVLVDIYKTWRKVVKGGSYDDRSLDDYLNNRGLLARLFKPMLRVVANSWNMYPIGVLFGLGFDTASEVGLLAISGESGARGMPIYLILLLPLLFVAGMSLVDTTDGIAMLGAYGWAYVRPVRKLYYNMNITLISVLVALFIGGIEILQVVSSETTNTSGIFGWAQSIPFNILGFYIIGAFILSWAVSVVVYKLRGIDRLDDAIRTDTAPPAAPA
jgi:high-affinity nickel-transport protein